jgi:hypothetical protein
VFHLNAATKRVAMMRLSRFFSFFITAVVLSPTTAGPRVYRNEEFGITLPMPEGALLCPTPVNEHDHGPVMLLGPARANGCGAVESSRSIWIFAGYNAADVTKKLQDFLKWECRGPCGPPPRRLHVTGLPSAAARVSRSNGWIDIIVVTQAGKPDPTFDPSVPLINYDLKLHTRPENLKEDLRVFRTILETVRLSPAQ